MSLSYCHLYCCCRCTTAAYAVAVILVGAVIFAGVATFAGAAVGFDTGPGAAAASLLLLLPLLLLLLHPCCFAGSAIFAAATFARTA